MRDVQAVVDALLGSGAKRATRYLSEKRVVKATRRHKPDRRARTAEFVVTVGAPNYAEREFIRVCRKAREPLPVRRVVLTPYPKKRG